MYIHELAELWVEFGCGTTTAEFRKPMWKYGVKIMCALNSTNNNKFTDAHIPQKEGATAF